MALRITGDRISLHKGDNGVIEVQCFTDDTKTTPLDITGYTVDFLVATDFTVAYANLTLKKDNAGNGGCVITDAVNGKYQIQPVAAWTSALAVVPYVYSTKIISPGGAVYTMAAGVFELMQNLPNS